jgi:8-oxo-dGTP pyrophosphatase MutT (NUDIX family)
LRAADERLRRSAGDRIGDAEPWGTMISGIALADPSSSVDDGAGLMTDRVGDRVVDRPAPRQIVAVLLVRRGRLALLRRSSRVRHDAGAWHCVTGFLDAGRSPARQARLEIWEETGLGLGDVTDPEPGPVVTLPDGRDGRPWTVHTFIARTGRRRLTLNWENDEYRWVRPADLPRVGGQVTWLDTLVRACSLPDP